MNLWEKFAKEDAEYYILSYKEVDYTSEEGQRYFYNTGRELMDHVLKRAQPYLQSRRSALEIGCGIGRLTIPHANVFEKISAVDISSTMLEKLKANAQKRGLANIQGYLPHQDWDHGGYDYVYSFIVFQHIADFEIIKDYFRRISKCVNPDGIIQIQIDTRPATLTYRIRNMVPDFLLPKDQKKGIRRIRRTSEQMRALFNSCGLEILEEFDANDENHTFILKRKQQEKK
jgi:cyclopropane fatty-acyl-phospholipid synthase-like methyltransferase